MTAKVLPNWLVLLACAAGGAQGCRIERELGEGDTLHAPGFSDPSSAGFHGSYLVAHGYPLGACRECHGDDYAGGTVGSSCNGSGCHTEGVESCGTCHEATPTSGAHTAHAVQEIACDTCHEAHADARSPLHPNGAIDLRFGGLALAGADPSFDSSQGTCSEVYCHGGGDIEWRSVTPLVCSSCHSAPPESHGRFATAESDCTSCHGGEAVHIDGQLDVAELSCHGCHGKGPLGAPPAGLLLAIDGPGVGAHARHLDSTLPDRMGRVAECDDCHSVPGELLAPGHIDGTAPADVELGIAGSYAAGTQTCVVGCHWDAEPGPPWGDDSGAQRACDACHGLPPLVTRAGTTHPPVAGGQAACASCHVFDPLSHVDGKVDFVW